MRELAEGFFLGFFYRRAEVKGTVGIQCTVHSAHIIIITDHCTYSGCVLFSVALHPTPNREGIRAQAQGQGA